MSNNSPYQHPGNLFYMLHTLADVSLKTAQEVESYLSANIQADTQNNINLSNISLDIEPAATVIPATVMFVDLRNFTALVEEYPPNQMVRQLNEYFSGMTRIIVEHGGTLDKYMGDEIMAYFECKTPLEYTEAAHKAVYAGIQMIQVLEEMNLEWDKRGWPTLKCGIGINSGPVLKGNIGSMVKLETTIIGDTVNVASRLQQLNKDYDTRLLISAATHKLVLEEYPVRSLGELHIRGRRKPIGVYEVDLPAPLKDLIRDCADETEPFCSPVTVTL